jgi:hypothetical protein
MTSRETILDDDLLANPWPALGWIVLAAAITVVVFLLAPLP